MYQFTVFGYGQGLLEGVCTMSGRVDALKFIAQNLNVVVSIDDLSRMVNGMDMVNVMSPCSEDEDGITICFDPLVPGKQWLDEAHPNPTWAKGLDKLRNGAECLVWAPQVMECINPVSTSGWMVIA